MTTLKTPIPQSVMDSLDSFIANNLPSYDSISESSTDAYGNTKLGKGTLLSNVPTGDGPNTAIGFNALYKNNDGYNNTAIGAYSLYENTFGTSNVAVGESSLRNNRGGADNTAIGWESLVANTEGSSNTAIGLRAMKDNIIGSNNTVAGFSTNSGNWSGSVILGSRAIATADNQFVVGSSPVNAGLVSSEVNTSSNVWNVIINGVARKILLA